MVEVGTVVYAHTLVNDDDGNPINVAHKITKITKSSFAIEDGRVFNLGGMYRGFDSWRARAGYAYVYRDATSPSAHIMSQEEFVAFSKARADEFAQARFEAMKARVKASNAYVVMREITGDERPLGTEMNLLRRVVADDEEYIATLIRVAMRSGSEVTRLKGKIQSLARDISPL